MPDPSHPIRKWDSWTNRPSSVVLLSGNIPNSPRIDAFHQISFLVFRRNGERFPSKKHTTENMTVHSTTGACGWIRIMALGGWVGTRRNGTTKTKGTTHPRAKQNIHDNEDNPSPNPPPRRLRDRTPHWSVCLSVCVCVCAFVCVRPYIRVCAHVCPSIYICAHICVCARISKCLHLCVHVRTCLGFDVRRVTKKNCPFRIFYYKKTKRSLLKELTSLYMIYNT